ncbi:hypothetical protein HY345_00640 [Candidatus Microgenomates bacterium]|nr:hypothetical protein [Candidatus Microgenomates bacterium]
MIPKAHANFGTQLSGITDPLGGKWADLGAVINDLVPYAFVAGGLLLMVFLTVGGFGLLTSGGDPKKIEAGKEKIVASLVGFFIVFGAYWIYILILFILGLD